MRVLFLLESVVNLPVAVENTLSQQANTVAALPQLAG
jgi:hypothetical protein